VSATARLTVTAAPRTRALRHVRESRGAAKFRGTDGLPVFPDGGLFEVDGRVVTFVS